VGLVDGLEITRVQGQPFVVSPLIGQAVDAKISILSKATQTWMLVLGIPGTFFSLSRLGGGFISLINVLVKR